MEKNYIGEVYTWFYQDFTIDLQKFLIKNVKKWGHGLINNVMLLFTKMNSYRFTKYEQNVVLLDLNY